MAVSDPLDMRLLSALADAGKIAVHELAAKIGMDPREAAYRLVTLSGQGLPLLVGVESDVQGLRSALLGVDLPRSPQPGVHANTPSPPHGVPRPPGVFTGGPPAAMPQRAPVAPDPAMSTWGPPQTASWVRGDQLEQERQPSAPLVSPAPQKGRVGEKLATRGLEGEQLTIQLLEVQDPANFLFAAAGYRLEQGERAIVVHTEVSNKSDKALASLPDNYLELITMDGRAIGKAPISLTSRLPHRIGIRPGETVGGHTVYVMDESTPIVSVRWSPRPEPDERTLLWSID